VTPGWFTRIDTVRLRAGHGVTWGFLPEDTVGAWAADMDFGIPASGPGSPYRQR
jgi:cysteine-S-conjugate beta-lyase